MRHIAYRFRAATSFARGMLQVAMVALTVLAAIMQRTPAAAETRPHYGGTLHVMLQSAPDTLAIPTNATPSDYEDLARTLSLIGDTLVRMDAQGRAEPALATSWQSDATGRHWEFTIRRDVKFHDGSAASPAALAQIIGALHPAWSVRASADSIAIDSDSATSSVLAEVALPRNLLLKKNKNDLPIGTGAFLVAAWQPGKVLRLAANEESWRGRPFVDAIEIEFGKSLRDQAIALELHKTDMIEAAPQAGNNSQPNALSSLSLPVELLALVFNENARTHDPRLREALALAIDRKPIQSVLLKGAGEPAATVIPNWMTGYAAVFSIQADPQKARALVAESRQPALNLSYDPRDPQAQLIAERIALNAREVGVTVQVSLSGVADLRLMRIVLPSPEPATSLAEAARQMGLPSPTTSSAHDSSLEDLYQSETGLLNGYAIIPLFHLPLATLTSPRVRAFQPGRMGEWNDAVHSLGDAWLAGASAEAASR